MTADDDYHAAVADDDGGSHDGDDHIMTAVLVATLWLGVALGLLCGFLTSLLAA